MALAPGLVTEHSISRERIIGVMKQAIDSTIVSFHRKTFERSESGLVESLANNKE